ncbi:short-chain dehydrogenase/reductase SDR [Nemania abortiva]|nr:short-chain dehydrogenase/reductase SDR [Nemania abortiva]
MASPKVVVVVGCGGMGLAIARRLGVGRRLLLADFSDTILSTAKNSLSDEGYSVDISRLDVSDFASTSQFVQAAAATGTIETIVHTAGATPSGGSVRHIYEVNLLGTANVIDAFLAAVQPDTSLICIASMAGHLGPKLSSELERHLATAPRDQLLSHTELNIEDTSPHGPGLAYAISKRGNVLRVQAAAKAWGHRGARVNSVSPGVISTSAGRQEITGGEAGKFAATAPAGRLGTPQDIVNAVAFLASPESSFITGNDLLVDGGVVSTLRWNRVEGIGGSSIASVGEPKGDA